MILRQAHNGTVLYSGIETMKPERSGIQCLTLILALSFLAGAAHADQPWIYSTPGAYTEIGNTVFGPGNSTYTTIGDTTFGPDNRTYTTIGNTTFGPDNATYTTIGDTTFGPNNSTYTTIGNTTFGPGNSSCTMVGNTTFCN